MTIRADDAVDRRAVVLAPTRRDADATAALLDGSGIPAAVYASFAEAITAVREGAAAFLLPEEALTAETQAQVSALLGAQPPWSDLPLLLLTYAGADSSAARGATRVLGNVTLLERPLRVGTLVSALRAALRARERQYQIREHLTERARAEARFRAELETRVHERTAALALANQALETEVGERRAAERQIKALFERLVSAQEEERRRIARDIHDQLGQQMTALRMRLDAMDPWVIGHPEREEHLRRTQQVAEELDRSIDFLTWELRPAGLDDLGLAAALQTLVTSWSERFGIPATFKAVGGAGLRLPQESETNVYRLVQEALHNIVKHAHARRVSVSLRRLNRDVVLAIKDDGAGFDLQATQGRPGAGLGLISMRERAMIVGGTLEIETSQKNGTTIALRVPARGTRGAARRVD